MPRISRPSLLLAALAAAWGCTDTAERPLEPAVTPLACGRPEVMYATFGPEGGRFGGLDLALEPGEQAVLRHEDQEVGRAVADENGRFGISHDVPAGGTVTLEVCGASVEFTVRDPAVARVAAVRSSLGGVGSVPNDLIIVGTPGESTGVVVRSGDNAVSTVGWTGGVEEGPLGVRLPETAGPDGPVAASPWLVGAVSEEDRLVAVSAWAQGLVYIVDVVSSEVRATLPAPGRVVLDSPFELTEPFDVDGDGVPEARVEAFFPSTPQPVTVVQGRLLVGYASILRVDRGPAGGQVALPAVVASYDLADLAAPPTLSVLDALNPQEIRPAASGGALVTCSGLFRIDGLAPVTPGAVFRLEPQTLEVLDAVELPELMPTTALEAAGRLWVGSLAAAKVVTLDWRSSEDMQVLLLGETSGVDSIFRLLELPGGLLGSPSFNTDRLFVIDPRTVQLDAAPFYGPLQIGPGGAVFSGLQIVARRPGRAGVDFVGPDLMALSGLSASVTPVELRKVLGP